MRMNYYLTLKIALAVLVAVGLIGLASMLFEPELDSVSSKQASIETELTRKEVLFSGKTSNSGRQSASITVRVEQLIPASGFTFQTIPGTTRAAERAVVRSQVAGKVLIRNVRQGQTVNANEVLITLYNPEASPLAQSAYDGWQQAIVAAKQQERNYQRTLNLHETKAATDQELENANTALLSANANRDAAEAQFNRASQVKAEQLIRAPFNGVVTQTLIEAGEVVSPGQALIQLANADIIEVEIAVSERILNANQIGDEIPISFPLLQQNEFDPELNNKPPTPTGRIIEISPFRESGALPTVVVQINADSIPGTRVRPGSTALLHLSSKAAVDGKPRFSIPISAVIARGENSAAVYKLDNNNKVQLVSVKTHDLIADRVLISGNLATADTLVVSGTQQLFSGAAVKVLPNSTASTDNFIR